MGLIFAFLRVDSKKGSESRCKSDLPACACTLLSSRPTDNKQGRQWPVEMVGFTWRCPDLMAHGDG